MNALSHLISFDPRRKKKKKSLKKIKQNKIKAKRVANTHFHACPYTRVKKQLKWYNT